MCECLVYADGDAYLCVPCADMVKECPQCGPAVLGAKPRLRRGADLKALIIRACKEAWDTPGDEWGIAGHPNKPLKTDDQIAGAIADTLLEELS